MTTIRNSTIVVDTGALSKDNFNITLKQKEELYRIGYQITLEFIPQRLGSKITYYKPTITDAEL